MLTYLRDNYHDIVILANKIDKLTKNEQVNQLKKIQNIVGLHKVLPFSAEKRIGIDPLMQELQEIE
jgi:GTP-binding protein EngB required for normal cell division